MKLVNKSGRGRKVPTPDYGSKIFIPAGGFIEVDDKHEDFYKPWYVRGIYIIKEDVKSEEPENKEPENKEVKTEENGESNTTEDTIPEEKENKEVKTEDVKTTGKRGRPAKSEKE